MLIRRRENPAAFFKFRGLVRKVIANRRWLQDYDEDSITSGPEPKRGFITSLEKTILIKNPEFRAADEVMKVGLTVSSLKCLSRYPARLRTRLAGVTHFLFYPPGRVIVKEGRTAMAMYFILDGYISLSKKIYRSDTTEYVSRTIGKLGPGESFGEVALLSQFPRTVTCSSATDVELLCIYVEDFDRILRDTLQSQWEQVHLAVKQFDCFKNWTEAQLRECCILGTIKEYNPMDTIYCEDRGLLNFVHFVISGKCLILQCLKTKTQIRNGNTHYKLCEIKVEATPSAQIMDLVKLVADKRYGDMTKKSEVLEDIAKRMNAYKINTDEEMENVLNAELTRQVLRKKSDLVLFDDKDEEQQSNDKKNGLQTEFHFVDVGTYSSGSVFGLGEYIEHRAIMARTTVQCLLIPRYWLFQKEQNVGNIWERTRTYLDSTIPSRGALFKNFLAEKKWKKYKKSLIDHVMQNRVNKNPTKIQDVPIICRILNGADSD